MGCVIGRIIIMALRPYSVMDILLPTIIIIVQECPHALKICECLWSLSYGGLSNMLLVLLITFHCHYSIWGRRCSTGPFQFKWLKGYIHSSCYNHHQIGRIILTRCYHIFPWLCAWDVCCITFCHLHIRFVFIIIMQFLMSAKSRIRFGLQIVFVRLYITPFHYHHCANLSVDIELMKCLSDIFCRVCE